MAKSRQKSEPLPSKAQILEFIQSLPVTPSRRELLRAFRVGAKDRDAFKKRLMEIEAEGSVSTDGQAKRDHLPSVSVLEITGTNEDGDVLAAPANWPHEDAPPAIYLVPDRRPGRAPGSGDRVLARLNRVEPDVYRAQIIRRLPTAPSAILGIYTADGRVRSTDRRWRDDLIVQTGGTENAEPGELVVAQPESGKRLGLRKARIIERLGITAGPKSYGLMAIHNHEIPTAFSADAERQAAAAGPAPLEGRVDLRHLPLITIDDEDARDFDDAVWAEPDPEIMGGWHIVVAIADVAWYVRDGDALDRVAAERGNSVYFPDQVVPMLPEILSNEWCSLKPGEDRPCLAAHLWVNAGGALKRHHFERALMRSAARLTYAGVQAARLGEQPAAATGVFESTILPLFAAYETRCRERSRREPLDLDLPEQRIELAADGRVERVYPRARLDSHRLIEEFMILANIAAAETIEAHGSNSLFRIHDEPDLKSLEEFRQFLASVGMRLPKGQALQPRNFNQLLRTVDTDEDALGLQDAVLRAQSRAVYSPVNIGHFGLALRHYAHFTSPIRRYADLMVHRALISTVIGGAGGFAEIPADFERMGEYLSMTERRAEAAEREAIRRFSAEFLMDRIGHELTGRVANITRNGMFVQLMDLGVDGFVPMRYLPSSWRPQPERNRRVRTVRSAGPSPGAEIRVRLREVDPPSGSIILELA